jgi:hypothetical protein
VFALCASTAVVCAQDVPPVPRMDSPNRSFERVLIFFPPNPPPLGRPVARGGPTSVRSAAPPAELASYVSEFFYPALGSRLAAGTLNDKLRARLDAYRDAKVSLQSELRGELDRLRSADPAERANDLATLSRRQTPKIVELEKTAEQLRRDLIVSETTWSAERQWHLSDKERRGFSPIEIAQVMRAYAFYENGLLPAQRRLLREISIELQFAGESADKAAAAQPFMFFPPEPARVLLPDDMTAEVAARVAAYQTKKSVLKKELYDAVHASDGAGLLRAKPLRTIAEKQAARLAELDVLAEEIRVGLKEPPGAAAARSPLSVEMEGRIDAMVASFRNAQKDAVAAIEAILSRARDLPIQTNYRFEGDGLRFAVGPARGRRGGEVTPATLQRIEAVRAEISAVAEDYGRRMAEMLNVKEALHVEIGRTLSLTKRDEIDRLLFAAMRRAGEREADETFNDYRLAVYEPGLSPEQRRLLFDRAVEQLDLPLPRGELRPTSRANAW